MKTKQIIFTGEKCAEVKEVEYSQPSDNEILVKMSYTTISNGTEKANLTGDKNVYGRGETPDVLFPRFTGYSGAGIVEEVGKNVTKVKKGDRVATSWGVHKGICSFREDQVDIVPDSVSLSGASMVHIATFPIAAIRKVKFEIGESAIVMGMGILGAFAVKLLRAAGASVIIAADPVESRRDLAMKLGADYALNPFDESFIETVKKLTDGGAKTAIEVTGIGTALDQVLDCMADFGRVALLGCTRASDFTIDYYKKVHCPGITLVGAHTLARPAVESSASYWTTSDDKKAILKLIENGRLSIDDMISEIHEISDAGEVYTRLAEDKDFPIGVQFKWNEE